MPEVLITIHNNQIMENEPLITHQQEPHVEFGDYEMKGQYGIWLSNDGKKYVLFPSECMQKGDLGYANLNNVLQKHLNHTSMSLSYASTNFKEGDRVMQITNDYEKDVFNGDIGVIDRILWDDRELRVDFGDKIVSYAKDELDELQLAYAITIHKSQGSEYPVVIIPVSMKHRVMLQRNLIYTAITRAKKRCIIIGQKEAVVYAVNNVTIDKRNGKLSERLKKSVDSISKE